MAGRYGPYVKFGKINATLPKETDPQSLTLDQAIALIAAKGGSVKSAVRRSAIATGVFCVLYWIGLVFVYPSLTPSKANTMTGSGSGGSSQ